MVVDYRDTVLAFVRSKGPVLPVQIAKELRTEILMASAMLSEMTSKGTLRVSHLKIGGSPLYYIPGQEAMLLGFTKNLNEKDQRTLEFLRDNKVVRDQDQDALTRVSLRGIKDFAQPLNVTHAGTTEIFWKWQQVPDADASALIKQILTASAPAPAPAAQQQTVFAPVPARAESVQAPVPKVKPQKPKVVKQKAVVKEPEPERIERRAVERVPATSFVHSDAPITQTFLEDPALSDPFYKQIQDFCVKANIKILEHAMVTKKLDYDLIIQVPSPVGSLVYYAKARNKAKLNDTDLSGAFTQGQLKKLPAMLLAPGELSKKAQELLAKELRGVAFTRLA
ncbi:MAG TPA: hypothetical protein VLJ21_04900 [Candidatus Binatia bacterium]|nr:hypothetical protein [Candidatus Binatia bacterium]